MIEIGDIVLAGKRRAVGVVANRRPGFYLVVFTRYSGLEVEGWYPADDVKAAIVRNTSWTDKWCIACKNNVQGSVVKTVSDDDEVDESVLCAQCIERFHNLLTAGDLPCR